MIAVRSQPSRLPRVLALLPSFIPSTILTVVKPLTLLHRNGQIRADITLESHGSPRQIERADVVVFSRNCEPECGHLLEAARALGRPVIYDIDDNFFELPSCYPRERHHLTGARMQQLERYLRAASLVRVYSGPMRDRASMLNRRVVRVEGPVDWSLVPAMPPRRDPKRVHIVYATNRFDDALARLFMNDLRRIVDVYAHRVAVCFWGFNPAELRDHRAVRFRPFVPNYDRFFRRFSDAGFDIGLAPLYGDVFHRSKSNNKFREYAAARIAGVYSNVDVYSACVEDGRTGLLVSDEAGAWYAAIARLIEDASLRTAIQEQAHEYARTRYGLEKSSAVWWEQIGHVLERPAALLVSPTFGTATKTRGKGSLLRVAIRPISRAIYLVRAMRRHGRVATGNRIRRTVKDWRLLLYVKWQLHAPRAWRFR